MPETPTLEQIKSAAETLAAFHAEDDDNVLRILWFPSVEEIRLIDVDPSTMPHRHGINPYYFGPDPSLGVPFPSAVAVVAPEDLRDWEPPSRWGARWEDGVVLWERANGNGS